MSPERSAIVRGLGVAAAANVGAAAILILRNLLDSYFAAAVSVQALAALTATVPVTLLLIGLSQGISVVAGHAVVLRRKQGADGTPAASLVAPLVAHVHLLAAGCGVAVALVLELLCSVGVPHYVADPQLAARTVVLLRAILVSGPLLFLYGAATAVLRASDMAPAAARAVAVGLGSGAVLTALLMAAPVRLHVAPLAAEPLLGIAVGLACGYALAAALALRALARAGLLARPAPWPAARADMAAMLRRAAPAMATNTVALAAMFVVTAAAARAGPEAMAAFGAVFRIEQFGMIVLNGIVLALVPLAARQMRDGRPDTLFLVVTSGLGMIGLAGLAIGALLLLAAPWVALVLHLGGSAAELLASWLRFAGLALVFQGITQGIVGLVQVRSARLALLITMVRLYGVMLPLLWWLSHSAPQALYLAMSATHVAGGCVLLAVLWYRHRQGAVAAAAAPST